MTGTAHRPPITSHPAFAPVIALWFAALLGLTAAVLPGAVLERILAGIGLSALLPLTLAARVAASALAAAAGALVGFALVRLLMRRGSADPRPVYAEADHASEDAVGEAPARRPLRVREELADDFADESQVAPSGYGESGRPEPMPVEFATAAPGGLAVEEGFMILTPQPIHPPLPAPDLEALLDQFDTAFAAFSAGEGSRAATPGGRADTVQAFVARQTGVPAPATAASPALSPLGALVPDHQAELRAALDKLARSQRGD